MQRDTGVLRGHELRNRTVLDVDPANDQLLMQGPLVEVRGLTAKYRHRVALASVSAGFTGGVTGVLGPNGAGKTTLLSAIATGRGVPVGTIQVAGNDIASRRGRRQARRDIGWLPQRFDLSSTMTVLNSVEYAAWANGVAADAASEAAHLALAAVGLAERANDRVRTLSGGQRQRVGLAASVAHQPRILLLDEPTAGLDPDQRARFRSYVTSLGKGKLVILATHLLEDVRQACDRVLVLVHGGVAFEGSPTALANLGESSRVDPLESPLESGYRSLLEAANTPHPEARR